MVNKIKIRKTRKEDVENIWPLEVESRNWHKKITDKRYALLNKSSVDVKAKREFIRYTKEGVRDKKSLLLVAVVDGQIVGYILVRFYKWKWSDKPHLIAKIGDLTVLKKFGRKGIASMLIKEAEKITKKRGVKYFYVGVWTSNKSARKLYKKNKFEDFHREMFKKLK